MAAGLGPQLKRNPLGSMVHETGKMTKARQACRLANDIALDLVNAVEAHRTLTLAAEAQGALQKLQIGINRVCLFQVIITLCKWIEFYDRYKAVLPPGVQTQAKELRQTIEDRGIREFRNKVAGHIWDDDTKQPLTNAAVEWRVNEIVAGSIPEFLRWINGPPAETTVVRVVESVRDALKTEYNISYDRFAT